MGKKVGTKGRLGFDCIDESDSALIMSYLDGRRMCGAGGADRSENRPDCREINYFFIYVYENVEFIP